VAAGTFQYFFEMPDLGGEEISSWGIEPGCGLALEERIEVRKIDPVAGRWQNNRNAELTVRCALPSFAGFPEPKEQ
jgi:hypothetical protein